jgi:hypothetical protein
VKEAIETGVRSVDNKACLYGCMQCVSDARSLRRRTQLRPQQVVNHSTAELCRTVLREANAGCTAAGLKRLRGDNSRIVSSGGAFGAAGDCLGCTWAASLQDALSEFGVVTPDRLGLWLQSGMLRIDDIRIVRTFFVLDRLKTLTSR